MDPADFRRKTRFVVRLGRALHECGTTSQRTERHLMNVTRMLGLNGSFLISPTTFTCAFWDEDPLDQFIHIERVEPADNNLGRLWEIDRLVESIADGRLSFSEGADELDRLADAPLNYSFGANAFSWALMGGSFSALLSANPLDCIAAALLSLVLCFIDRSAARHSSWGPVVTILAPFVSGVLAGSAAAFGIGINVPFVILSSIIIFIPGLALTVALTEISARHLISGSSRLVDAVMLLLKLFFGAIGGMAAAKLIFEGIQSPVEWLPLLPDWKTWPAIAGLSFGIGIALNIPPRKMLWGLLSAAIAFGAASLGESWFGMYAGMFLGALAVGLYSNLFSRLTRGPGSILMTQGIILLVPGSKTYMILNHWVSGQDILPGASSGNQALMVFIALIAGLLFSNALLPTQKSL
ncbi:MAG: threonine/serine exporter family protein [Akkermansiaceae bacterium]|nr:threonine/serine exporter family protein [Akkermansiaceae bacterium]MCP5546823.1 threonine/serine exporter family protein [Akkermansiaceae bacterium]